MSALIALENERDPCRCRSPETLPDSASRSPDKFPSILRQLDRRSLSVDTWLEKPSGTAIPSRCGSCECTRSCIKATPQAAGDLTRKRFKSRELEVLRLRRAW